MNEALFTSDVIYIAAADSSAADKAIAEFLCTGFNDQDVLQAAVDSVATETCGEIRGRRIILLPGNYYISDFPRQNANGRAAVLVPLATNRFRHITIQISGAPHTESSAIHVTREAYEGVAKDESCSIFACGDYNQNHYVFQDFYVTVPDDQKNIICFDGRFMGSMGLRRIRCICTSQGRYLSPKKPLPVEGFVAFMGTYGSNTMWEEKWEFCHSDGFGQGFAVGREHLVLIKCAALFGRYGYTFNNYPATRSGKCHGDITVHPMTLISCIDEANANLWKFAKNDYKQCINAYNVSFEIFTEWMKLGGSYSVEERPGDYSGHIDYVANFGSDTPNSPSIPFWEKGSGIGFETVNNVHKKVCTSAERRSYSANVGQEVFDTDLGKKLIYTGSAWYDLMGNPVDN